MIDFYLSKKKSIYYITLVISIIISIIIPMIYHGSKIRTTRNGTYNYIVQDKITIISESIFHLVCFVVNLFFLLVLMCYLKGKKKEAESGLIEDIDYKHHFRKIITLLILVPTLIIFSFFFNLSGDFDLLFLIISFILNLTYCVNRVLIKEILKLFCKDTYKKHLEKVDSLKILGDAEKYEDNEEEHEEIKKRQRTESF